MPPIEKTINRKLIVDKIAELLQQLRVIPPSAIITDIQFSNLFKEGKEELTKMKIFTRKEQGVKIIIHNET